MAAWSRSVLKRPLPDLPVWVVGLPVVGKKIAEEWQQISSAPSEELASLVAPYVRDAARWVIARAGSAGTLIVQFLLTVGVCAILYARGETAARGTLAFAVRLAGAHGVRAVLLSAGAIRAVALGIVVTAVVQAVFGGIGLFLAGVPHAILLTCVMLMLGVAQVGPIPVMLGAIVWLFVNGATIWGSVLVVWALLTASFDNILRPILIRKGADLPLLLIIAGVIGGLLAFGLIGLFVGPVILAVAYTLAVAWVHGGEASPDERDAAIRS